jgi:hypothetical protein
MTNMIQRFHENLKGEGESHLQPGDSGSRGWKDHIAKPSWAFQRDPVSTSKLAIVIHPIIPALQEAQLGELWCEVSLGTNLRPRLKNKANRA